MRVLWLDEIFGFLEQSNVSKKNLRRLQVLEAEGIEDVVSLASLVRRIAEVHPRKRKRWKRLKQQHLDLFRQAIEVGIVDFIEQPELESMDEFSDRSSEPDADWGVWIAPRPHEFEPTVEDLRAAASNNFLLF
jgi:hypothetical protein